MAVAEFSNIPGSKAWPPSLTDIIACLIETSWFQVVKYDMLSDICFWFYTNISYIKCCLLEKLTKVSAGNLSAFYLCFTDHFKASSKHQSLQDRYLNSEH